MKISRDWLQKYFDAPLPSKDAIADALTFHAFEIEGLPEEIDVKVLPNRAADCLSHRGIAKELSAILAVPLKRDPLREPIPAFPATDKLVVAVDPAFCLRHMGALVLGVQVGPSPAWLREAIESVGQRSINNVVDATNYVMLNIGQPMHAFDAGKITKDASGTLSIAIRPAQNGEKITILSGEEYALTEDAFVIADDTRGTALDIAGIKGGALSGITQTTTDLFISVGNYDGTRIRKTSQRLKIFTDAVQRYQNRPSSELCAYGMRDILALITEVAGGEILGVVDVYPKPPAPHSSVQTSLQKINSVLGSDFSVSETEDVFRRLDLSTKTEGDIFTITPPFERTDLVCAEDLAEEVGRIIGYDRVLPKELPPLDGVVDQARFRGIERVKDFLIERGFTEISTQSFAGKGDVYLANPLDKTKPALRSSLAENMKEALAKAKLYAPLLLEPNQKPKLFEIGTVFTKEGERLVIETSEPVPDIPEIKEDQNYAPHQFRLGGYTPFSLYPFITRDIAFWAPSDTDVGHRMSHIGEVAGPLLVKCDLFDTFSKDGKTSYAFRLVFQSNERTLTDEEVVGLMEAVTAEVTEQGWQVR